MSDPLRPVDLDEIHDAYVMFYRRPGLTEESLSEEFKATVAKTKADAVSAQNAKLRELADTFNANGNSRELGDPTARTWHEAALMVIDVMTEETNR